MKMGVFLMGIVACVALPCFLHAQNRLNSRLFEDHPPLYNSPSKAEFVKRVSFSVATPEDRRADFYGEQVYKGKTVQPYKDFWAKPVSQEIREKIVSDLGRLMSPSRFQVRSDTCIIIYPVIEVFYPDVRGFIWAKSFAKVRIGFRVVTLNNVVLLDNRYEAFYMTAGTDKDWEGSNSETIGDGANITIGIALRQALDRFYDDLNKKL